MALPTDLPTRVVTKTFLDQNGTPKKGPIDFELIGLLEQTPGDNRVDAKKTTTLVLSDGKLNVALIASPAANWTGPIYYKVTERLTNGDGTPASNPLSYVVTIPAGAGLPETWLPIELPVGVLPNMPATPVKGEKGDPGDDGREVEIAADATDIKWRYVGDPAFQPLISRATLKGDQGLKGDTGNQGLKGDTGAQGIPGKLPEFSYDAVNLRWRYVGDVGWTTLVPLDEITGPKGDKGDQGIQGLKGDTGDEGPAGPSGVVPPMVSVDQLVAANPFYIAHRGSGDEFPEHTMAAYQGAVSYGAKAIEVSVQLTADNVLVCMHDTTLLRTTGAAGSVADYTYAALNQAVKVKMQDLLGTGWSDQPIPTAKEVLDRFYGKVVIFIEPKVTAATAPLQALLLTYPDPTASIVWKSHYTANSFAWAKANGFRTWGYLDPATTSGQMDAVDADIDYWGVPHTSTNAQIAMVVAHAPIKPVICWEVHRRGQRDTLAGLGVKGMMTSGLLYVNRAATAMQTTDKFALKIKSPGELPYTDNDPTRALRYEGVDVAYMPVMPNSSVLLGAMSPTPASGYRIRFQMKWDVLPAVAEHAGIAFGKVSDDLYRFGIANTSGGYHLLMRGDGDFQLYKHDPGVGAGTQLLALNNTTPAPVAGTWMEMEVEVTPTNVTIRRLDPVTHATLFTTTIANQDYRGGYLHLLSGNAAGATATAKFRAVQVLIP